MPEPKGRPCEGLEQAGAGADTLWPVLGAAKASLRALTGLLDDGRLLRLPGPSRSAIKLRCTPVPVRSTPVP